MPKPLKILQLRGTTARKQVGCSDVSMAPVAGALELLKPKFPSLPKFSYICPLKLQKTGLPPHYGRPRPAPYCPESKRLPWEASQKDTYFDRVSEFLEDCSIQDAHQPWRKYRGKKERLLSPKPHSGTGALWHSVPKTCLAKKSRRRTCRRHSAQSPTGPTFEHRKPQPPNEEPACIPLN